MPRNLILAYIATWLIHGSYLVHLLRKSKKLRDNDQRPATSD